MERRLGLIGSSGTLEATEPFKKGNGRMFILAGCLLPGGWPSGSRVSWLWQSSRPVVLAAYPRRRDTRGGEGWMHPTYFRGIANGDL